MWNISGLRFDLKSCFYYLLVPQTQAWHHRCHVSWAKMKKSFIGLSINQSTDQINVRLHKQNSNQRLTKHTIAQLYPCRWLIGLSIWYYIQRLTPSQHLVLRDKWVPTIPQSWGWQKNVCANPVPPETLDQVSASALGLWYTAVVCNNGYTGTTSGFEHDVRHSNLKPLPIRQIWSYEIRRDTVYYKAHYYNIYHDTAYVT